MPPSLWALERVILLPGRLPRNQRSRLRRSEAVLAGRRCGSKDVVASHMICRIELGLLSNSVVREWRVLISCRSMIVLVHEQKQEEITQRTCRKCMKALDRNDLRSLIRHRAHTTSMS